MTWLRGLLIVALLVPALAMAEDKTVGTTAAVNPDATGTPPGGQSQTLLIGTDVVFKETIKTVDKGQTQILFVDQSTLTVAPNSEIVLDEFVYDPNTSTGKMAISLGKGLLRFVGGTISHTNGATISTPTAALTIRGGMAIVQSDASGTNVLTIFGTTTIQPKNGGVGAQTVSTPGTLTTVAGSGKVSTTQATSGQIQALYTQLQGPSSTGGVTVAEVNQQLGDQGMAGGSQPSSGSSGGAASNGSSSGNAGNGASGGNTNASSTDISGIQSQTNFTQTTQQQTSQSGSTTPAVVLGPFDGRYMSTPPPYTTTFGDIVSDPQAENFVGGPIGTDNNQGFTTANISNGRLAITLSGNQSVDLPIQAGSFDVTGSTTTPIGSVTGKGFYDPALQFFFYQLTGPGVAPDSVTLFGGTPTPNHGLLPGGSQVSFEAWSINDSQTTVPFLPTNIASRFSSPTVSPMMAVLQAGGTIGDLDVNGSVRSHMISAELDIEGQGANQKSMLVATVGGLFSDGGFLYISPFTRGTVNPGGGSLPLFENSDLGSVPSAGATQTTASDQFFGPNLNYFVMQNNDTGAGNGAYETDIGFLTDVTGVSQNFGYTLLGAKTTTPAALGTNRSSRTLNGYFADSAQSFIPAGTGLQTPYVVTNANGLPTDLIFQTDTNTNSLGGAFNFGVPTGQSDVTGGTLDWGGIGFGRDAYIDDQHIASANGRPAAGNNINGNVGLPSTGQANGFRAIMVSHDLVGVSGLLPAGVNLCTCDFLEWGYWTSLFRWDDPSGPNNGRVEQFNIGTWVAGDLTSVAQVQGLTGSATFGGHVIANVSNGTNQYLAAGSFSSNWNFATATGTVAINNLDTRNYTGNIATGGGAANNFSGTIASGTVSGPLNGSFFNAPGAPAKYMGGSITAQDSASPYRLTGTFAAQQP